MLILCLKPKSALAAAFALTLAAGRFGDCRRRCRCRERRCMHRLRRLRRGMPHGLHHRDQRRLIQILAASEGPVFKTSAGLRAF